MRSRKHLRTIRKLERARFLIYAGTVLVLILSFVLLIHVGIIYFNENKKAVVMWKLIFGKTYHLFADSRTGSVANGFMGLVVSVVGQLIFPAPWRSYFAVTILSIKQIIDIFLPM